MSTLHVALARDDVDYGVALVPDAVPASWTGSAATACQTALDDVRTVLAGLSGLLDTAQSAVAALDAADTATTQCTAVTP